MTTVFMVTSGDYSDFKVEGVFSTKEKAEEWIIEIGKREDEVKEVYKEKNRFYYTTQRDIIYFELDRPAEKSGYFYFTIHKNYGVDVPLNRQDTGWISFKDDDNDINVNEQPNYRTHRNGITVNGYGKTLEHARRSASDLLRAIEAGTVIVDDPYAKDDGTKNVIPFRPWVVTEDIKKEV